MVVGGAPEINTTNVKDIALGNTKYINSKLILGLPEYIQQRTYVFSVALSFRDEIAQLAIEKEMKIDIKIGLFSKNFLFKVLHNGIQKCLQGSILVQLSPEQQE